ncbi:MAG TPA: hypothetical protein VK985_06540 [Rariglobus sp.]|nr:hypothetical protein [Rariglobus sp.]
MKPPAPAPRRRQAGFALLITITLLAFLVLLLVSLSALTRVETQVAGNNQKLTQARQNALMAMNVALGRLQASAGPDTRATATADLVSGRHIDKKNWTGVWNASAAGADKNIAWLVSGTAPAGSAGVTGALAAASGNSLVELVGAGSTDIANQAATGNRVQVETQPITSDAVPGLTGIQTVGNFAYWVGDEGVKSKVSLADPWDNPASATLNATIPPTTPAQAQSYRFINAQRVGIESVDAAAAGTQLGGAYPATDTVFKEALPKILAMSQLPLANADSAGQTALTLARRNRFHDLTASSFSLLTDVVKGGFKKDLTAWIADSTTNPAGSPAASAAFITPGSSGFTYGLPKWALIRDYATTLNTGAAVAPRLQTDSLQGIYPVITYARMGFGLSSTNTTPSSPVGTGGGRYKYHIMPVIALWNPYNVPIQASTDDSNSYEICFRYTHNRSDITDVVLKVIAYAPMERDLEGFNLSRIRMEDSSGTAGYPGNKKEFGTGPEQQFWRFKVKLSKDLGPGESRLFTIDDSVDGNQYASGVSLLSDNVVDLKNSVHIPSGSGTGVSGANAVELPAATATVFLNTEPAVPVAGVSYFARMQVRLTKPVPAGTANNAINDYLSQNSYQAIVGYGFNWGIDTNPGISIPTESNRDENPVCAQHFELAMASLDTTSASNTYSTPNIGQPRWLAMLNPQAPLTLRKPFNETTGAAYAGPFYDSTPSYLNRQYIKSSSFGYQPYTHSIWRAPLSDATGNVSAGLQVSVSATGGVAQKLVLRELQPAGTPLFSLAQLQHANVSALSLNPAYAIGNSLANLYVPRDASTARSDVVEQDSFSETLTGFPQSAQTGGKFAYIHDLSYLLNKALWDGYFFSTVPATLDAGQAGDAAYHLPNSRHRFHWNTAAGAANAAEFTELKATGTAAAHLLLNGGFNINSTSVQAWRALLSSHNGVATDPADASGKTRTPYSRFTTPAAGAQPNATWLGYRILSENQLDALATAIVAEIRARGPSLSLADFVNRRLATDATGLKGPLQAAIDATTGAGSVNGIAPFTDSALRISAYPRDITSGSADAESYVGGTNNTQPSTSRAAFAPGYLTQADLLTSLGSSLTARSDTFRIRTYGDTVNPATGSTEGRAWCEVIVQRQPDYVDASANASTVAPGSATTLNKNFGRRFTIISFRWLSSNDI